MDLPLLQSKSRVSSTYIPPHPTQLHPRFNRHHPNPNHNSNFPAKKNLIVFSLSLFSLLFLLSAALRLRHRSPDPNPNPNQYGVVIYASPDRSQVHVFTSLDARSESSRKVGQGLLWLGGDSERIRGMVSELVEFAKGRVLRSEWEKTKVQMVGDGELERLEMGIVAAFLDTCRGVLRGSGFLFKDEWVTTLGGKQEAVYDWVAANYALGNLGKEPQRTDGIVKLGGTSMQITFSSLDPDLVPVSWVVKLAGVTYNLYTESMPYFGQDAMRKSLDQMYNSKNLQTFSSSEEDIARDPCLPKGYKFTINATNEKVVAGNFSLCISHVRRALLKRKQDKNCMQSPCEIVSSYSIKLRGKPVPLNNFFFISEFFGLVPMASLSELEAAGHHYCEDDWHKLKSQHNNIDDLDLIKYCFVSAYVVALLHDNFGISMIVKRIGFANPGGNVPPTWIYGAFLLQILQEPVEMERVNTEEIVGNDTVTYLSLFTVLLIAVLGAIFLLKYRKPQLKTVYDLQKGQYLVTRLPK